MKKVKIQSVIMYLHGQILGPLKVYFSEECYDTVCLHFVQRFRTFNVVQGIVSR